MAIRENTPVKVIGGLYDGRVGKVVHTYPNLDVAIVSFDDNGDVGKISLSALVEIRPQKQAVEPEIPEGAKKISRADFDAALIQATTLAMAKDAPNIMGALSAALVGERIGSEIFKESDVVVMTETEFIGALWDGCHPQRVSENVDKAMDVCKSISVSIASVITLRTIPRILFGAENG